MDIDDNTKRFVIDRLKWLGFYTGISFILLFLLPFPYDIVSVFGLFTLITYLRKRSIMKRYGGMGRIKDMLGSVSMSGVEVCDKSSRRRNPQTDK